MEAAEPTRELKESEERYRLVLKEPTGNLGLVYTDEGLL